MAAPEASASATWSSAAAAPAAVGGCWRAGDLGLTFRVRTDTLIPAETEVIVRALASIADRGQPLRRLNLGTGTGCLLLTLLHELPQATGLAIDRSPPRWRSRAPMRRPAALQSAPNSGSAIQTEGVTESFDLIVSNPPYITTPDIDQLAPEVARHRAASRPPWRVGRPRLLPRDSRQ